jgi:hypothetical protein
VSILVDANVLSELTRPVPDPRALSWLRRHEDELVIDPVLLGEIRYGILLLPAGARRRSLQNWFDSGISRLTCLPWDAACGLRWARLLADLKSRGQAIALKDSLIAATALVHEVRLATRNVRDFRKTGVTVVDPFE